MTITSKTWTAIGTVVAIIALVWAVFTFVVGGQQSSVSVSTGDGSPVVVGNGNTQTND